MGLDPAEAGVLASALLMVGVSLVTAPPSAEVTERFFGADERQGLGVAR